MNKRELVSDLRSASDAMRTITATPKLADAVRAAANILEREAEREEAEVPKITLRDQVMACISAAGFSTTPTQLTHAAAAAKTLRRLEEDGGKLLVGPLPIEHYDLCSLAGNMRQLLYELGVEPSK